MRGNGTLYRRGRIWWIQYWHKGVMYVESARTASKTEAGQVLRDKIASLASGRYSPEERKLTVSDALKAYLTNLELRRGKVAAKNARVHAKPLEDPLGAVRLLDLRREIIDACIRERLMSPKTRGKGTISPSKVNRETALLRSALHFAEGEGKIGRMPRITMLSEPPARQGFWGSRKEFEAFAAQLPNDDLRDVVWCGFLTGWRRSEVFALPWSTIDWNVSPHPELRIPRTKNQNPRVIPLVGELKTLFERRRDLRKVDRAEGSTGIADLVFHRGGHPLGDIRGPWKAAIEAAGLPPRTWHDFRRTAARNMVNAGVPEKVAMEITGHLTRSIFDRYHIVAQKDKAAALLKTMEHVAAEQPAESNVRPLVSPQPAH